ncbi:MAG: hypothetical protein ABJE47_24865 [bacterium]
MRSLPSRFLVAAAAFIAALSCGDVPTLERGIAYVTPIILPSPAVAAGDVMRDSLGNPALLQVIAYDNNNAIIPGIAAHYLITSPLPPAAPQTPLATVDSSSGKITATDTVTSLTLIARVGDRIQTTPATVLVVSQPDSVEITSTLDSLQSFAKSGGLSVKVSSLRKGTRVTVDGIVVRYQIVKVNGAPVDVGTHTLVDANNAPLRIDARRAVDTTKNGGVASRFLSPVSLTGVDSIVVEARANSLKGTPLPGSPVRFVLPVKKGA